MKQNDIKTPEDCRAFIREAIATRCQRLERSGPARLGHLAAMQTITADDLRNVADDVESATAQLDALNRFAAIYDTTPAATMEPATWMTACALLQAAAGTSNVNQFAVVLVTNWMTATVSQAIRAWRQ